MGCSYCRYVDFFYFIRVFYLYALPWSVFMACVLETQTEKDCAAFIIDKHFFAVSILGSKAGWPLVFSYSDQFLRLKRFSELV